MSTIPHTHTHIALDKRINFFVILHTIQGSYPWTYLNPHDPSDTIIKMEAIKVEQTPAQTVPTIKTEAAPVENVRSSMNELDTRPTALHFGHFDIKVPTSIQSSRSSMNQTSSGILEVLTELENEEQHNKTKQNQTAKSQQDLSSGAANKEESKRSVFKSLLKRTHSAPKKIDVKIRSPSPSPMESRVEQVELSPPVHVSCCHPFVDKIKTMADNQLHKNKVPKKPKIKTVPVDGERNKIVLVEATQIIRLRESPKAERKNVAAYMEKRDSDEIVEIIELDESPSETRKRREQYRRNEENVKPFVVPANVTQSVDNEPTIDELLEEEFKNDLPKKSPRRTKEHIYEDIQPMDDVPAPAVSVQSILVQKSPEQYAALHEPNLAPNAEVSTEPDACALETQCSPTTSVDQWRSIEINVDHAEDEFDENVRHFADSHPKLEAVRDATLSAAEKKVTFSQSTEEYQEKIAAERGPEKEDVELPDHLIKSKWSNMR